MALFVGEVGVFKDVTYSVAFGSDEIYCLMGIGKTVACYRVFATNIVIEGLIDMYYPG